MTDQRYGALKELKRIPYSGVVGCGFMSNGMLTIIIPPQGKEESDAIADAIEGVPDLIAKIEELQAQVKDYRIQVNCGGGRTGQFCGSPQELNHEIYGAYHGLADGTLRCELHYYREAIEMCQEKLATLERLGRRLRESLDIERKCTNAFHGHGIYGFHLKDAVAAWDAAVPPPQAKS